MMQPDALSKLSLISLVFFILYNDKETQLL